MKIGIQTTMQDSLFHLNNTHLNKSTSTIFEELKKDGYTTGAINTLVYRGDT